MRAGRSGSFFAFAVLLLLTAAATIFDSGMGVGVHGPGRFVVVLYDG